MKNVIRIKYVGKNRKININGKPSEYGKEYDVAVSDGLELIGRKLAERVEKQKNSVVEEKKNDKK